MVGELPSHSIASALRPFQDAILQGPWPNRHMLLLPLASGSSLMAQGAEMARGTPVNVRTSPQVTRPADAWGYINGTWGRLGEPADAAARRVVSATAPAATPPGGRAQPDPLTLRPMPVVQPQGSPRTGTPRSVLDNYVHQLCELPGMVSCCVFDVTSGLVVAHAGASPRAEDLAMQGKMLLGAMGTSSRSMGMGHALPEAAITLGSHHLLLRAVPGHPRLALHAALDKASANLTLVRLQVQRLDAVLTGTAPGAPQ